MYWSDYNVRPRRKSRWGCTLLLGLLVGVIGTVLINGWGRGWLLGTDADPTFVAADVAPSPSMMETATPDGRITVATPGAPVTGTAALVAGAGGTVALNEAAPNFTLPDLSDAQKTHALSDYRGRPVILNFWASWCVPCRREMPALQDTAARYETQGLLLLGMNQTYLDDLATARAFVEELGLDFPNTRDLSGSVGADAYQVVGLPTTVFVRRGGTVAHIKIGEMSLEQITIFTERLIEGRPLQP